MSKYLFIFKLHREDGKSPRGYRTTEAESKNLAQQKFYKEVVFGAGIDFDNIQIEEVFRVCSPGEERRLFYWNWKKDRERKSSMRRV